MEQQENSGAFSSKTEDVNHWSSLHSRGKSSHYTSPSVRDRSPSHSTAQQLCTSQHAQAALFRVSALSRPAGRRAWCPGAGVTALDSCGRGAGSGAQFPFPEESSSEPSWPSVCGMNRLTDAEDHSRLLKWSRGGRNP